MTQLQAMQTVSLAIIIIFLGSFAFMLTQVTTSKTVEITQEQVVEEEGQYYLLLDNRRLEIRESFLQHLQPEQYKDYKVTYSFNKLNAGKGKVVSLEAFGSRMP